MDKWIQLQSSDGTNNLFPVGRMDLLWTNGSPTSDFGSQTIPLDLSDYNAVLVTFKWGKDSANPSLNVVALVGVGMGIASSVYNARVYREFTPTSTGIQFAGGYYGATLSSSMGTGNGSAVPYQIYGIRSHIVDLT